MRFAEDAMLTPLTLEELAAALGVRWPEWYRRFVLTLLEPASRLDTQDWLPGGFIIRRLWIVWAHNMYYRRGWKQLWQHRPGRHDGPTDWPFSHMIVGSCDDGVVVVDTKSEDWILLVIDKNDCCLRPFTTVRDHATSPEEFAERVIAETAAKGGGHLPMARR